ncbi:MAG: thioredoxin [Crocinitomicaceae bacterium]|nr:thioredoxin [Crocinitomicaceae bacterium]
MSNFREIINSDKPTLVDFYATWCGPCKTMHPILDELKNEKKDAVRILKIDVDKNQDVAQKFKIRGVPTFILFKKGEIIWRQSGAIPKTVLEQKIREANS